MRAGYGAFSCEIHTVVQIALALGKNSGGKQVLWRQENLRGTTLILALIYHKREGLQRKNKVAAVNMKDQEVRVAVAQGIRNVKAIFNVVEEAKGKQSPYDLIEIMSCYGGCIGVRELYVADSEISGQKRPAGLYVDDKNSKKWRSHKNLMIQQMYQEYIGERAHHLRARFVQKPIIRSQEERLNK